VTGEDLLLGDLAGAVVGGISSGGNTLASVGPVGVAWPVGVVDWPTGVVWFLSTSIELL
jgi:hypothetical protein